MDIVDIGLVRVTKDEFFDREFDNFGKGGARWID
jgi:hypothetical protein